MACSVACTYVRTYVRTHVDVTSFLSVHIHSGDAVHLCMYVYVPGGSPSSGPNPFIDSL